MKKIKKIRKLFYVFLGVIVLFTTAGCFKRDSMENIKIYATAYPIEYITKRLYGSHSDISSIYPDGINIDEYKLTNKQIGDFSNSNLFIFNGLSGDKNLVQKLRKHNKNLKIIDSTISMEYTNSYEELWLDPSNFLMLAQNIKNGFEEYINNYYLNNSINNNYEKLKIEASNLDAKIKQVASSASNKVIVASSDMFRFLEKYDLTVYSLEENENLTNKTINDVKNLIDNGSVDYIFIKSNEETNKTISNLIDGTNIKTLKWHTLSNITEMERTENQDYFSIMNENLELLKDELYNDAISG